MPYSDIRNRLLDTASQDLQQNYLVDYTPKHTPGYNYLSNIIGSGADWLMKQLFSPEGAVSTAARNVMEPERRIDEIARDIEYYNALKPSLYLPDGSVNPDYQAQSDEYAQAVTESPLYNALAPENIGIAGIFAGPKATGWKNALRKVGPLSESKVVDEAGNPMRVYHGTKYAGFKDFSDDFTGKSTDYGNLGQGFYFTNDPNVSNAYAGWGEYQGSGTYPSYTDIKNPLYVMDKNPNTIEVVAKNLGVKSIPEWDGYRQMNPDWSIEFTRRAKDKGYDGVVVADGYEVVAFNPSQIHNALAGPPDIVPEGAFSSLYDKKPRFEIDDSGATYNPGRMADEAGTREWSAPLGKVMDHPALYENYPELRNYMVSIDPSKTGDTAAFNPYALRIDMSPDAAYNLDSGKKTLLHEVQHGVQEIEDSARGGNPKDIVKMAEDIKKRLDSVRQQINWYEQKYGGGIGSPNFQKVRESLLSSDPEYNRLVSDRDKLTAEYSNISEGVSNWMTDRGFTGYNRLAGEIEARDTAARSSLNALERAKIPPYSSENIAPENALVRFGGGEAQMAVKPQDLPDDIRDRLSETKVVDGDGKPLVVYHSTNKVFDEFDIDKAKTNEVQGFYFSRSNETSYGSGSGRSMIPVYLDIKNPAPKDIAKKVIIDTLSSGKDWGIKARKRLEEMGYDGIDRGYEIIAFSPDQIISALSPGGTKKALKDAK